MLQRRARVSRLLSESFGPQEECVTEQQWLAGATTALPPTREDIDKLLAIAPKYGIVIRLPH